METGYTFDIKNCEVNYKGLLQEGFTPAYDMEDEIEEAD